MPTLDHFYRAMLRIRLFEERVLDWFPKGVFYGTTHTYIGQEADAIGVLEHLLPGDIVVSNHRCHGHFLAYGGSMHALAAELMGRQTGVCAGRGGSQHIQWRDFYANGILGGTVPLAAGMALAERGSGHAVMAFIGDGALGEGVVYESLNMCALWSLPMLVVLENNRYAQSTPIERNLAGTLQGRFEAFGIPVVQIDTTDVVQIHDVAGPLLEQVREGGGPRVLIIDTYRFGPHSKGDDTRDPAEIARFREKDPLALAASQLPTDIVSYIDEEAAAEVEAAFGQAQADPPADPGKLMAAMGMGP
ncbi:MAG: thiamine pyrophosphate-dependent dehydrogenase E1 component subunit alpha [Anaerolineales bacterium]|jgi:TPP-dependent pyruvate/acetoin dehydrogenase alpha subunit